MARNFTFVGLVLMTLLVQSARLNAAPPATIPAEFKLWLELGTATLLADSPVDFHTSCFSKGCLLFEFTQQEQSEIVGIAKHVPDKYWQYYQDCDRWGVVFSVPAISVPNQSLSKTPDFIAQSFDQTTLKLQSGFLKPMVATFELITTNVKKLAERSLQNFGKSLIVQYKVMEFRWVETSRPGRAISPTLVKPTFILASAKKANRSAAVQYSWERSLADQLDRLAAGCQTVSKSLRNRADAQRSE